MGSNPDERDGFLMAIRIHSRISFRGEEVKPLASCPMEHSFRNTDISISASSTRDWMNAKQRDIL
jgi:hypothetical protein